MRNAGLEEAQAGIKIAGRNINNLRYADDTTLMAESEELKSLLMKVKDRSNRVSRSSFSSVLMCLLNVGCDILSKRAVSVKLSFLASSMNSRIMSVSIAAPKPKTP